MIYLVIRHLLSRSLINELPIDLSNSLHKIQEGLNESGMRKMS